MRTITVTVWEDKEAGLAEKWQAQSDYPNITFTGVTKRGVEHAVRGACLHVIGDWAEVPGAIQFRRVEL